MKFKVYFEPMIIEIKNLDEFENMKITTSIIDKIEKQP